MNPLPRIPDTLDICTAIRRMVVTERDAVTILRALSCSYGTFQHDAYLRSRVQTPLDELSDAIEEEFCAPPTAEEADEIARDRKDGEQADCMFGELTA